MKYLLIASFLFISSFLYSQTGYIGQRLYGPNMTNQWYVQNSPGNTFTTSKLVAEFRDSLYFRVLYKTLRVDYLGSSNNIYLKTDNLGNFSTGLLTDIFNPLDYYDKTQSDGRYLQTFIETDPNVPNYSKSLTGFNIIQTSTDLLYKPIAYTPTSLEITTALGYTPLNHNGLSTQYVKADGTFATFPTIGEIDTASNIGSGLGVFKQKSGISLEFKSFIGASNHINITSNTNDLTFSLANIGTPGVYGEVVTDTQGRITNGKHIEKFSGTTSGSGTYTVVFGTAYLTTPYIQVTCTNCTNTQKTNVTSITTTGFTVNATNETLGLIFTNANGVTMDVEITEK